MWDTARPVYATLDLTLLYKQGIMLLHVLPFVHSSSSRILSCRLCICLVLAYSATGNVTAECVYVNYGRPEDFDLLEEAGVPLAGDTNIRGVSFLRLHHFMWGNGIHFRLFSAHVILRKGESHTRARERQAPVQCKSKHKARNGRFFVGQMEYAVKYEYFGEKKFSYKT